MRSLDVAGKGIMELGDGFLRLRWRAGEAVGVNEAQALLKRSTHWARAQAIRCSSMFKASISPGQRGGSFLHPRAFLGSRSWGHPRWIMLLPFLFCG